MCRRCANEYFVKAASDTKFGASPTKYLERNAGITKSKIANVHVEALRRGAFLSGQTRIDESHVPDTWEGTSSVYLMVPS
jgi:hypothetical protein